jgi:hypothetical protein
MIAPQTSGRGVIDVFCSERSKSSRVVAKLRIPPSERGRAGKNPIATKDC